MRTLIIKSLLAVMALAHLTACEDNRMDGMVNDKVYIVQSGVQEVYVNYRDYADFTLSVYKSGVSEQTADASISISEDVLSAYNEKEGTSFVLLPDVCYSVSRTNFSFSSSSISYKSVITFDGDILKRYQNRGEKKYALPIILDVEGNVETNGSSSEVIIIPVLE